MQSGLFWDLCLNMYKSKNMICDMDEHVCRDYVDDDGVVVYHQCTANTGVVPDLDNCHW